MSEDEKLVNTKSVEFKQGVEAGLNPEEGAAATAGLARQAGGPGVARAGAD